MFIEEIVDSAEAMDKSAWYKRIYRNFGGLIHSSLENSQSLIEKEMNWGEFSTLSTTSTGVNKL